VGWWEVFGWHLILDSMNETLFIILSIYWNCVFIHVFSEGPILLYDNLLDLFP